MLATFEPQWTASQTPVKARVSWGVFLPKVWRSPRLQFRPRHMSGGTGFPTLSAGDEVSVPTQVWGASWAKKVHGAKGWQHGRTHGTVLRLSGKKFVVDFGENSGEYDSWERKALRLEGEPTTDASSSAAGQAEEASEIFRCWACGGQQPATPKLCTPLGDNGLVMLRCFQGCSASRDDRPVVAARFGEEWVSYEELMERDRGLPATERRSGLHEVPFHANLERVTLEVLNLVHSATETSLHSFAPTQRAKIYWERGCAAGFLAYHLANDAFTTGVHDESHNMALPKLVGIYVLPAHRKKGLGAIMVDDFFQLAPVASARFVAVEMPITDGAMSLIASRLQPSDYSRMVGFEGGYCRGNLRDLLDEAAATSAAAKRTADGEPPEEEARPAKRRKAKLIPEPRVF